MNIEEAIAAGKPIWRTFIVACGYSAAESVMFAEAYADEVRLLPTDELKMQAIEMPRVDCALKAFEAARIEGGLNML